MNSKEDSPGDAETRRVHRVTGRGVLSWQHMQSSEEL